MLSLLLMRLIKMVLSPRDFAPQGQKVINSVPCINKLTVNFAGAKAQEDDEEDDEEMLSPRKRSKKKTKGSGIVMQYKLLDTFHLFQRLCDIWEFFAKLLKNTTLSDSLVQQMVSFSIDSMAIAGTALFQERSLSLISTVFAKLNTRAGNNVRDSLLKEITSVMAKLASLPKKSIAYFKLPGDNKIMMLSRLLIGIVQECAIPTFSEDMSIEACTSAALQHAEATGKAMVQMILFRCANKVNKNLGDEKFHSIANDFVEDCCKVVLLPEFPGANMILDFTSIWIYKTLKTLKPDEAPGALHKAACLNSTELVVRKMLVQMSGAIAATLKLPEKALQNLSEFSYILPATEVQEGVTKYASEKDVDAKDAPCVCTQTGVTFSNSQLTKQMVAIFGGDVLLEGSWFDRGRNISMNAHIRSAVQEQISRLQRCDLEDKDAFEATVEREYQLVLMQLFTNYFRFHDTEPTSSSAYALHAARWAASLGDKPELRAFVCKQSKEGSRVMDKVVVVLPDMEMQAVYSQLISLQPMFKNASYLDGLLAAIINMMSDPNPQLRTKACKAFTRVVNADSSILMNNPAAQSFIYAGVHDRSPAVREATVDLMGTHMLQTPELINEYYDTIHGRIQDVATSVRKRMVSTFREVLTKWPTCAKSVAMCTDLVQRIRDDEETIRDMVVKTLSHLWFVPISEMEARGSDLAVVANQIVEVLAIPGGIEWVTEMLNKLLNPKEGKKDKAASAKAKKAQQPLYEVCTKLCAQLVQDIRTFDEEMGDPFAAEHNSKELLKRVAALNMFGGVNGNLVAPHITALQTYLADQGMGSNEVNQKIVQAVLQIIDAGLPTMQKPDMVLLEGIEKSLGVQVVSAGRSAGVLHDSAKCLCNVVNLGTRNYPLVEELLKRFHTFLASRADLDGEEVDVNDGMLRRYIVLTGLFCRYYSFDLPDNMDEHEEHPGLFGEIEGSDENDCVLEVGSVNQTVLKLLWKFYKSPNEAHSFSALQSMGHVFCRNPQMQLTTSADAVFTQCLQSPTERMRAQILRNLATYLKSETDAMTALGKKKTLTTEESDRNADSGVSSSLIQKYIELIKPCCVDESALVRAEAAQVMQFIVNQRLVGPFHCVPSLIALGCDDQVECREIAHKLLGNIFEKHPEFVSTKATEGVKLAYDFLGGSKKAPSLHYEDAVHGIKRLYKLLQSQRQRRESFIDSIFAKISQFLAGDGEEDTNFYVFLVQQLGFLPYIYRDEVLLVIYKASKVLSRYGEAKLPQLRQLAKPEEYQESSVVPTHRVVHQVAVVSMLIVLKAYLKDTHAINDEACEKFAPSARDAKEKDKPLTIWNEEKPPVLDLRAMEPFLAEAAIAANEEEYQKVYRVAKDMMDKDLKSDFTLEKKKQKRTRAKAAATPTPDSGARKTKAAKKKTAKKRRSFALSDDDDDDDEEDFDDDDF